MQCAGSSGDAAIAVCIEAIKKNSGNWKLYYIRGKAWSEIRGKAWSEKQEYDKAVADYSEAITMDPKQIPLISFAVLLGAKSASRTRRSRITTNQFGWTPL
jgi:tetratricopeptide (TPR) repeat protein